MRVWTVSQAKAGTLTQCLGVASRLDPDPRIVQIERNLPRWQLYIGGPKLPARGDDPDVIISCGYMAERYVQIISKQFRRRPFLAHLQTPSRIPANRFDRLFISRHDWSEAKADTGLYEAMIGVPHRITHEQLNARRSEAKLRFARADKPTLCLLVGGSNKAYAFDEHTIQRLVGSVEDLLADGWRVLATTSRRSEPRLLERFNQIRHEDFVLWDRRGDNPYLDYLAAADAFLVTRDTVTMLCEALTSGMPVYTFPLAKINGAYLEKFEWFHRDMCETLKLSRYYDGTIEPYTYEMTNQADVVSARISALVGNRPEQNGR